jgi:phosphoglycolate phosphatase-like HAD superfamily hydrolase
MPLDVTRIKAVCFDVDGTLSDTDNEWVDRISRMMGWMEFAVKQQERARLARWLVMATESPMNALYHWADHLSLDDNFARLFAKRAGRAKARKHPFWLMDGTVELLDLLFPRMPLSVVTARDEMTTMRFIDSFDLKKYFKLIVSSQTCEHTKPFPAPVLHAAKHMGISPENCVMIGDTTVDIIAGRDAGAQTIGLLCGFGTEKELRRAGADLIVNELRDILPLFTK